MNQRRYEIMQERKARRISRREQKRLAHINRDSQTMSFFGLKQKWHGLNSVRLQYILDMFNA